MSEALLTLNVGSSSVKAALYDLDGGDIGPAPVMRAHLSGIGGERAALHLEQSGASEDVALGDAGRAHEAALHACLDLIKARLGPRRVTGVGHRVVHGGRRFAAPVALTAENIASLRDLIPLAPGHQPHNLAGVDAAADAWPDATQVACFDTSFHRTQPRLAQLFAIPRHYFDDGVLRYGFHGLSYEYIAGAADELLGDAPHGKMIVAHLGAGASLCAIQKGESVASSMGFTALDGLPMATRCGDIDPGVLIHWIREEGVDADALERRLYKESGLLGLSGISADMRTLEASAEPYAQEAVDYFIHHGIRQISALAGALGGVDALIFTAGIGENSALVRAGIVNGLAWLGFDLDPAANETHAACITSETSARSAWVIPTNEELMIARHALSFMASSAP